MSVPSDSITAPFTSFTSAVPYGSIALMMSIAPALNASTASGVDPM